MNSLRLFSKKSKIFDQQFQDKYQIPIYNQYKWSKNLFGNYQNRILGTQKELIRVFLS